MVIWVIAPVFADPPPTQRICESDDAVPRASRRAGLLWTLLLLLGLWYLIGRLIWGAVTLLQ
jgi:hypothetical protein